MSHILNCIAIDDEPIALKIIRSHAEKVAFLRLNAAFLSATEALAFVQKQAVDLIFLDINMPDLSGIEFASIADTKAKFVFTTAYAEYAVQGFELAATDYLLKPISFVRFLQACNRVHEQHTLNTANLSLNNFLFVKDGYSMVRINLNDLLYIAADDNYLTFYEGARRTVTRMTLVEALQNLPKQHFLQVHKSYIVALPKVEQVERHQLTIAGTAIPVSGTYRKKLLERLNLLL